MQADPPRVGVLVKIYPKISETFIHNEIAGLIKAGLPVTVISLRAPTDEITHEAVDEVKVPVVYVPRLEGRGALTLFKHHAQLLVSSPWRYLQVVRYYLTRAERGSVYEFVQAGSLARLVTELGIVHLHAHYISIGANVAELVKRFAGVSYSISAHAKDIWLSQQEALRRKLADAEFTVTCTEYNRQYLRSLVSEEVPVFRSYHGIDTDFFHPPEAIEAGPPMLLSIGRLREKKGFPTLLRACKLLADRNVDFHCAIIGYGELRERLASLIVELGLEERVSLLGKLAHSEVLKAYRRASVFVLPCQIAEDGDRDGIPNVLLEAMAMRVPVVSSPISGIPEVVEHRRNGLLVAPGDAQALADAIVELLNDPRLGAALGNEARITVNRHFSTRDSIHTVKALLLDVPALKNALPPVGGESFT